MTSSLPFGLFLPKNGFHAAENLFGKSTEVLQLPFSEHTRWTVLFTMERLRYHQSHQPEQAKNKATAVTKQASVCLCGLGHLGEDCALGIPDELCA